MKTKCFVLYKDENIPREKTVEFAINKLESGGWYKKNTVEPLLKSGFVLENDYAYYSLNIKSLAR